MIKIEQYKLFHNSQDFEKIFKKSISEIKKNMDYNFFCKEVLRPCLDNRYCFILFENNQPIGYEIAAIQNRVIHGGFTFILPEHRGKKYSYLLREQMFNLLRDKADKVSFQIFNSNTNSIISAKKLAEKLSLDLQVADNNILSNDAHQIAKKYTIDLT
jgi:hypothetical protein